jgi:hypothetical protein
MTTVSMDAADVTPCVHPNESDPQVPAVGFMSAIRQNAE